MRRTGLVVVLISAILGTTACTSAAETGASATATTTSPSAGASSAAPDTTAATCDAAKVESLAAAAEFSKQFDAMAAAALAGDEAKGKTIEAAMRQRLSEWESKLTTWANSPVKTPVRTALLAAAALVKQLNDPADETPANVAKEKLAGIAATLALACA